MTRRTPSAKVASEGVTHTRQVIEDELGWLFRDQPTEDFGIDAHAEVVDGDAVRGRLLALQIKSGESRFHTPGSGGWWFRLDAQHVQYWLNHSLPVVVVLYRPVTKLCYWQLVNRMTLVQMSTGGWKLLVPEAQVLGASAVAPLREAAVSDTRSFMQPGMVHGGGQLHERRCRPGRGLSCRSGLVPPLAEGFQHRSLNHFDSIMVLSGMGGVGKTQLAAGIAEAAWITGDLEVLVWVTASSRQSVVADFARAVGHILGVEDDDPEQGARRFLDWLVSASDRWLIVLDDLQAVADLAGLWPPQTPSGQVVVTTRRRDAALRGLGGQLIELDVFGASESAAFLTVRLRDHPDLIVGAERLAAVVGHLPLALSQAAAYVIDRRISCAEYATRFADRHRPLATLSPEADSLPDQHRCTMAVTWEMSVKLANRLTPHGLAAPLLQVISLLSPHEIPAEVFAARAVLDHLTSIVGQPVDAEASLDALYCLHRLNLVTCDPDNSRVRVHALVQRATRDGFTPTEWESLPPLVADALLEVWPDKRLNTQLTQSLRMNAAALYSAAEHRLWNPTCHPVIIYLGNNLGNIGQVSTANDHFADLLHISTRRLGPFHPATLLLSFNRAYWQAHLLEPYSAMLLFEALIVQMRRHLGKNHPYTLLARRDLARWQGQAGYIPRAISTLKHVRRRLRKIVNIRDENMLITMSSLAFWQGEARHTAAAISTTRRYQGYLDEIMGADHPDTLTARHNLGLLISDTGDHTTAVNLLTAVLADQTHVLGPEHPDTLRTRHNLALTHGLAGNPHGAAQAFTELYNDEVRVLRADQHHDIQRTRAMAEQWKLYANWTCTPDSHSCNYPDQTHTGKR